MSKRITTKVSLKDKDLPGSKAKNVKGGLIGLGNVGLSAGLLIPGPHVITGAGPGAGPHVK